VTCCSAFTSLSCEECQTWSRVFGPPRTMSTVCLDQLWCALHLISCGAQCACQPAKKLRKLHVTKSTAMQSLYFQIAACENRHAKNSMRNAHYLQQAQPLNTATACTLASMELLTCIERPAAGPALATRVAAETAFNETCTLRHQSQHTQAARKHPMRVQRARALLQPTCCNLGCSIALLRSGPGQRCGCCRACPAQPLNVPGALHCVNFTG